MIVTGQMTAMRSNLFVARFGFILAGYRDTAPTCWRWLQAGCHYGAVLLLEATNKGFSDELFERLPYASSAWPIFILFFIFKATPLGRSRAKPLGGIVLELDLQVERQK